MAQGIYNSNPMGLVPLPIEDYPSPQYVTRYGYAWEKFKAHGWREDAVEAGEGDLLPMSRMVRP